MQAIRRTWQVGRAVPENRYRSWRTVECAEQYSRFLKNGLLNQSQNESARAGLGRASTRLLSNILQRESPSATAGSWDRASCRNPDTRDSAPKPCLDGRNSPLPRKSFRSCRERGTCAVVAALFVLFSDLRRDFTTLRQWRTIFSCAGSTAASSCAGAAIWV